MIKNYGNTFVKWRKSSLDVWAEFTEHKFVHGLKNGTLEEEAFLRYLRQDYIFLLNFSRAWALAIVKTDNLEEMRMAANLVNALLNEELQLHVKICQERNKRRRASKDSGTSREHGIHKICFRSRILW